MIIITYKTFFYKYFSVHIPVSQISTVYLNVRLSSAGKSTARWSMKVHQERCEDNLVRKFGEFSYPYYLDAQVGSANNKYPLK